MLSPPQVYENYVVACMDEVYRSVEALHDTETMKIVEKESDEKLSDNSNNWENDSKEVVADESDHETINNSVSSHGDSLTADEEKVEKVSMVPKQIGKNASTDGYNIRVPRLRPAGSKPSRDTPKKGIKPDSGPSISTAKSTPDNSKNMKVHPKPLLETSDGADDRTTEQENKDKAMLDRKIEEMETRVEKLEGELRSCCP